MVFLRNSRWHIHFNFQSVTICGISDTIVDIDSNVGLGYPTDNPISVSISNAAGLTA